MSRQQIERIFEEVRKGASIRSFAIEHLAKENIVKITGLSESFYQKQLVQEIIRKLVGSTIAIVNEIEVS